MRLIPKDMIPASLWNCENSVLHLPPQLISSWEMLLDKNKLRDKAMEAAPEGFEGGMSKEDTDNHLAGRFTGSSARVMLSMLDPNGELAKISDAFICTFSGNRVFLADLPCGSGAISMSILSVLCELRKQGRIPRMPLHIVIVGGEISKYAQNYAKEAFESLITELEAQAITIEFEVIDWDVCDRFSNTELIKCLTLKSQDCAAKLLVLANFSGFLQRDGKWKKAEKQFDELFRHSRERNSIALWIEPHRNDVIAKGGLIPKIIDFWKKLFSVFMPARDEEQKSYVESSVKVKHPLMEGTFRNSLVVVRFDFPLQRKKS